MTSEIGIAPEPTNPFLAQGIPLGPIKRDFRLKPKQHHLHMAPGRLPSKQALLYIRVIEAKVNYRILKGVVVHLHTVRSQVSCSFDALLQLMEL